eukprot:1180868-Prorocentrum_minimum.AAC.1
MNRFQSTLQTLSIPSVPWQLGPLFPGFGNALSAAVTLIFTSGAACCSNWAPPSVVRFPEEVWSKWAPPSVIRLPDEVWESWLDAGD